MGIISLSDLEVQFSFKNIYLGSWHSRGLFRLEVTSVDEVLSVAFPELLLDDNYCN